MTSMAGQLVDAAVRKSHRPGSLPPVSTASALRRAEKLRKAIDARYVARSRVLVTDRDGKLDYDHREIQLPTEGGLAEITKLYVPAVTHNVGRNAEKRAARRRVEARREYAHAGR